MPRAPRLPVLLLATLSFIACSKGGDAKPVPKDEPAAKTAEATANGAIEASCNKIDLLGICTDHTEKAFVVGADFVRSACTGTEGRYSGKACPKKDLVGSCELEGTQIRRSYAKGGQAHDAGDAKKDCERRKGKWSVPAASASGF